MKFVTVATFLSLTFALCESCASTATQSPVASTAPRRHRRRAAQPVAQADTATSTPAAPDPQASSGTAGFLSGLSLVPTAPHAVERHADGGAMDARTAPRSIGTPIVVGGNDLGELHAHWTPTDDRARIRCEGTQPSIVPSMQSAYEPGSAAIVRSFIPVERRVLACRPTSNARGRLPAHGVFASNGAPVEYSFPGVTLTREQAMCVGEALCAVRMPAFRSPSATVDYEVMVTMTSDAQ